MNVDAVFEAFEEAVKSSGKRGEAAWQDLQSLIKDMKPEVTDAYDLAVRMGGEKTHLNTLQAQLNAVVARTTANYDTFSATQKRDIRVSLITALFTAVKLAV